MKAKLKESAPFPSLKIKKGFILNKENFSEDITDPDILKQIRNLEKVVETNEELLKKKRVLKEENHTEKTLKIKLKKEIEEILIRRGFDLKDLAGLKKSELIEIYLIDRL